MSEYFSFFSYLITLVRRRNVTYWCSIHYNLLYSARLLITTAVVVVTEAGVSGFKPKQCVSGGVKLFDGGRTQRKRLLCWRRLFNDLQWFVGVEVAVSKRRTVSPAAGELAVSLLSLAA